jgi:hypothetical protein
VFSSRRFVQVAVIGLAFLALASCETLDPLFQPEEEEQEQEEVKSGVSLAWQAPTSNADGTPLGDLAGFRVYYGTVSPLTVDNSTAVDVGNVTSHTVSDLQPGTYYFAVSAVDQNDNASQMSDEVSAEVAVQ